MSYTVRTERSSGSPIAVVRRRVPASELPRTVTNACGLVWNALKIAGISNAGRNVAVYRDAHGGLIDVEAGVETTALFSGRGEIASSITPAGDVVTTTHLGPYQQLGTAHQAIWEWCKAHGLTPAGPRWEIYGHWQTEWNADPFRIRTDIVYLLKS